MDTAKLLSQVDLFGHLKPETFAAVLRAAQRRDLVTGEILFREGERGEFLFVVAEGALDAFTHRAESGAARSEGAHSSPTPSTRAAQPPGEGHEDACLLRRLGVGDVGGLTSIILKQPRSATLVAACPSVLLVLAERAVEQLLEEHPDFSRSLIAVLSAKVRGKTRALTSLIRPMDRGLFRVAFYDTKAYDQASFQAALGDDVHIDWLSPRLDERTVELAAGHHAVCAFVNDDLSRATLVRLKQLGVGLVALRCAGFNNVDLPAAAECGITVLRVPAYSPEAVAEHAVALLLTLSRKTHRAYNRVHEGNFSLVGLVGNDLHGRTAGLIGLGQIGKRCAAILRGFGMRVLAYDSAPDRAFAAEQRVELVDLETLVRASDVISLHAPLLPSTRHLIDAERVGQMKQGVTLINTSRGGLVDTRALLEGLKSGQVGAAGLDVYEEESEYFFEDHSSTVISDDLLARLLTFNNVLVTSHQGFLTHDALSAIASTTLANIRCFARGQAPSALPNRVVAP